MALLTATAVTANTVAGMTATAAADVAGDTMAFVPGKRRALYVVNGSGAPITVTVTALNTSWVADGDTFTIPSISQAIAAGEHRIIPITMGYADASNIVTVSYSAVTSVTVRLLEF